jgi:hypothetical protein
MSSLACPNCGAPATVPPGQSQAYCTFCSRSFDVAPPAPPVSPYGGAPASPYGAPQNPYGAQSPYGAPPSPYGGAVPPQFVMVPPGQSYGTSTAVVAAAGWAGFRLLMAIIPICIIALVSGITWFTSSRGGATRGGPSGFGGIGGGWTNGGTLVCGGNDEISATDITSSTGIVAGGNCHVTCVRCTIVAAVGVSAGGNSEVDLVDSHVTGTSGQGIVAGGNASVRLTGNSTLVGKVVNMGNGSVSAPPPVPTGPPAAVAPAPPAKPTSGPSHVVPVPVPSSHH